MPVVVEPEAIVGGARSDLIMRKSSFAGDVLKLVGGTTLAQALVVLVMPVLSRLYPPDAFGTAAVFASITALMSGVACLRYEQAIMLPERDEDAANLLAVSLWLASISGGFSAALVMFVREPIIRLLNAPGLMPHLWLVPLTVMASGWFLALNYWNSRTRHFWRLSIARVFQSVATSGAQLGMGAVGEANAGGLIGAGVLGSAVVTVVLGGQIWRDDRRLFRGNVRLGCMFAGLRRYRKFPLLDMWGTLLNGVSWQLPALMLSVFFSQTVVGYYALANRLIQLPMALIGGALAQVFFQRASEAHAKQTDLATVVEKVFQRLVALGLLPALLMTIAGRELFIVVFGRSWAEAGIYTQILGLWMFFWFISSPLSTLYVVLERQELGLILHVAILITRIFALAIGGLLDNVYLALGLFAGSGVLVYAGLTTWNMVLAGVSLCSWLRTLLQYGLYCLPAVAILLLLKLWCKADAWLIFVVSAIALLTYYAFILRRDTDLRRYLLSALLKT